jgi:hypothetical protein
LGDKEIEGTICGLYLFFILFLHKRRLSSIISFADKHSQLMAHLHDAGNLYTGQIVLDINRSVALNEIPIPP